jgi:hypothetical protein
MPSLDTADGDLSAGLFGHLRPVERQHEISASIRGHPEPYGDVHRADLVAVHAVGVGRVIGPSASDIYSRRVGEWASGRAHLSATA